ncbi:MAG: hypothetical protein QOK25_19 [Thermoleophilaceae bacterium]|nr:hypothetical protein [Thermoleophilaceae bacterium]
MALRKPFLLRLALWSCVLMLAGYSLHALGLLGGANLHDFFQKWINDAIVLVCAAACVWRAFAGREDRWAWALIGLGMTSWAAGNVYYSIFLINVDPLPIPSVADGLWLGIYPPVYIALVLLARRRVHKTDAGLWLDGVIAALAVSSVCGAVVVQAVLTGVKGSSLPTLLTNLAYPVGDLVLLALVVAVCALNSWRLGARWMLLACGFVAFTVTDGFFLVQNAAGTYKVGTIVDAGWLAAAMLVAFAAWAPERELTTRAFEGVRTLVLPVIAGLTALGTMVYVALANLNVLALALASLALAVVIVRMALTFSDNHRMLRSSRIDAETDPLTGLSNRRRLLTDLEQATSGDPDGLEMLVLFDLNGFKTYNDTYGHAAGDSLLMRIGEVLARILPEGARAYRMGGDEFCSLVPISEPEAAHATAARIVAGLSQRGDGFEVTASFGTAVIGLEATDSSALLGLADRRMYAQKHGGRRSAPRQSADVLLAVLQERSPELGSHVSGVRALAEATARAVGIRGEELEQLKLGGELHDIGKIAVPKEILAKPGPLDEDEWRFMRTHTIIGQRVVGAAASLAPAARIVRSSHERWDGSGYPDGLAAHDIPIGARVVFACDAFDAMTSERPYQPARTVDGALAELRRCAGTQFDPEIVDALEGVVRAHPGPAGATPEAQPALA